MNPFVKLTVALEPSQAQPLVAALRAAGIEAYIQNEHLTSVLPGLRVALGGMPIYVRDDQREAAEAFLQRADEAPVPVEALACPACGGPTQLRRNRLVTAAANAVSLTGFAVRRPKRVCRSCGHSWRPGGTAPFSVDELGYNPDAPLIDWRRLARNFRAFLAWTRSIGRETRSSHDDDREPPR